MEMGDRRNQSMKITRFRGTDFNSEKNADGYENFSDIEFKGQQIAKRSSSSPAFRIRVTFHRPLTWQVSSSSNSSSSSKAPTKSMKVESLGRSRSKVSVNENVENNENYVNLKLNGNHVGVVAAPGKNDDDFTIEIPITPSSIKRKYSRKYLEKLNKRNSKENHESGRLDAEGYKTSFSNHPSSPGTSSTPSSQCRKRKKKLKFGIESEEEFENKPVVNLLFDSFRNRIVYLNDYSEHLKHQSCNPIETSFLHSQSQDHDRHGPTEEESYPVMTWFKEPDLNVNRKDNSNEMGANGSTFPNNHGHGGGRLKSRSQSSSALHAIKPSETQNNILHSSQQVYCNDESSPYFTSNTSKNNHHQHNNEVFSHSIPVDLWDLPLNSQSYSPSRYQNLKQLRSHRQECPESSKQHRQAQNKKHRLIQLPVVEALISRSKKEIGRRISTGSGKDCSSEADVIKNRSRLYAISCPDVTQNTFHGNINYGASDYEENLVDPSRPQMGNRNSQRIPRQSHLIQKQQSMDGGLVSYTNPAAQYIPYPALPFITLDNIYELHLQRDTKGLGLGFSVTGGIDSEESFPGFVRVKKVFPMGPAFQSGRLRAWDIILNANGVPLTGLRNHEALEVLRTTPTNTVLTICRPPDSFLRSINLMVESQERQSIGASYGQLPSGTYKTESLSTSNYFQSQPCGLDGSNKREFGILKNQFIPKNDTISKLHSQESCSSTSSASFSAPSVKSKSLSSLKMPSQSKVYGEFEVTLEKIGGSLGFTLRQEDSSVLGHYVRALVKDPALSDGRIQPGDRILSVNSQDLLGMSHTEAVTFLRQCPPKVTLRLYRDISPTPISPLSPPETHKFNKSKQYRQEAIDMLNDLALRKQTTPSNVSKNNSNPLGAVRTNTGGGIVRGFKNGQTESNDPATFPRRRPGYPAGVTPSPEVISAALDRFAGKVSAKSTLSSNASNKETKSSRSLVTGKNTFPIELRSSGSGESTSAGTVKQARQLSNRAKSQSSSQAEGKDQRDPINSSNGKSELIKNASESPGARRKPSFRQYTMHLDKISSFEDDSLDNGLNSDDFSIMSVPGIGSGPSHENGNKFNYGHPAYQSAIIPSTREKMKCKKQLSLTREDIGKHRSKIGQSSKEDDSEPLLSDSQTSKLTTTFPKNKIQQDLKDTDKYHNYQSDSDDNDGVKESGSSKMGGNGIGNSGLTKWKGILFSQNGSDEDGQNSYDEDEDNLDSLDGSSSVHQRPTTQGESDCQTSSSNRSFSSSGTIGAKNKFLQIKNNLPQRFSPDGKEHRDCDMVGVLEVSNPEQLTNGEQILTVQLSRRWCSRLGFSIKGYDGHTYIIAIYPDSLAGRDGRLRVGDEIIMVNNESILNVETSEVIDMMRKTRGVITITLLRKPNTLENDTTESPLGLT